MTRSVKQFNLKTLFQMNNLSGSSVWGFSSRFTLLVSRGSRIAVGWPLVLTSIVLYWSIRPCYQKRGLVNWSFGGRICWGLIIIIGRSSWLLYFGRRWTRTLNEDELLWFIAWVILFDWLLYTTETDGLCCSGLVLTLGGLASVYWRIRLRGLRVSLLQISQSIRPQVSDWGFFIMRGLLSVGECR